MTETCSATDIADAPAAEIVSANVPGRDWPQKTLRKGIIASLYANLALLPPPYVLQVVCVFDEKELAQARGMQGMNLAAMRGMIAVSDGDHWTLADYAASTPIQKLSTINIQKMSRRPDGGMFRIDRVQLLASEEPLIGRPMPIDPSVLQKLKGVPTNLRDGTVPMVHLILAAGESMQNSKEKKAEREEVARAEEERLQLPGGYKRGEMLYYVDASGDCGENLRVVHGQRGEVLGPATKEERKGGLEMRFSKPGGQDLYWRVDCTLIQLSRKPPPRLPGGYKLGESVSFTGPSEKFPDGDRIVHGQLGEVVGPVMYSPMFKGTGIKGVAVEFPGNKNSIECRLSHLSRLTGKKVRLTGLNARPDLNGLVGEAGEYIAAKGRYHVTLPKGSAPDLGDSLGVKVDNLQLV